MGNMKNQGTKLIKIKSNFLLNNRSIKGLESPLKFTKLSKAIMADVKNFLLEFSFHFYFFRISTENGNNS